MFLFDWIMKVPDSYWKKEWNAERIRRQRAEADAKCYKDEADYTNESLGLLTDRDMKQARAIDALNKKLIDVRKELSDAYAKLDSQDKEIMLLHEALKSERKLNKVLYRQGYEDAQERAGKDEPA